MNVTFSLLLLPRPLAFPQGSVLQLVNFHDVTGESALLTGLPIHIPAEQSG